MFTHLLTPRLVLRPLEARDLELMAAYRSDPEVARYQSWEEPYSVGQGKALLAEMRHTRPGTPGKWYQLAIERPGMCPLVGDIGFRILPEENAQAEIGFTLAREHQGRGYATEAVEALLQYLFEELALHRVRAMCTASNLASARLLTRCGFRCEGEFLQATWYKGAWTDQKWFALLRSEWKVRSSAAHNHRRAANQNG